MGEFIGRNYGRLCYSRGTGTNTQVAHINAQFYDQDVARILQLKSPANTSPDPAGGGAGSSDSASVPSPPTALHDASVSTSMLEHINIGFNDELTTASLINIIRDTHKTLQLLNISECPGVDVSQVLQIENTHLVSNKTCRSPMERIVTFFVHNASILPWSSNYFTIHTASAK